MAQYIELEANVKASFGTKINNEEKTLQEKKTESQKK